MTALLIKLENKAFDSQMVVEDLMEAYAPILEEALKPGVLENASFSSSPFSTDIVLLPSESTLLIPKAWGQPPLDKADLPALRNDLREAHIFIEWKKKQHQIAKQAIGDLNSTR